MTTQADIVLTEEQSQAVELAIAAIKSRAPMFRLGGYAGTGKTTLIHEIIKACPGAMVCAYTGKAASVLRSKGIPSAVTIHSTIYGFVERDIVDPKTGKVKRAVIWERKARSELPGSYFIVDESSMVGKEILDDMTAYGITIIAVGDPGQLPPISKYDVNLMANPDFVLEKIHRQAEGSEIIQLATRIRLEPGFADRGLREYESDEVVIAHPCEVRAQMDADVFVCGFNNTRAALNSAHRRRLGYGAADVDVGERVICLSNDTSFGVFNGLMGNVVSIEGVIDSQLWIRGEDDPVPIRVYDAIVLWDGFPKPTRAPLSSYAFGGSKTSWEAATAHRGVFVMADQGHAITCHKSQGSQWDTVVVMNEKWPKGWDQARWLYTAVTRAASKVYIGDKDV